MSSRHCWLCSIFIGVGIGVWLFPLSWKPCGRCRESRRDCAGRLTFLSSMIDVGGNTAPLHQDRHRCRTSCCSTRCEPNSTCSRKPCRSSPGISPSTRWIIRGTAIRTFPRTATTRPSSRKLWKAFSTGSIFVTSPLPGLDRRLDRIDRRRPAQSARGTCRRHQPL